MAIYTHKQWVAFCDECSDNEEVIAGDTSDADREMNVYSKSDAQRSLRASGWSIGSRILCPSCNPKEQA